MHLFHQHDAPNKPTFRKSICNCKTCVECLRQNFQRRPANLHADGSIPRRRSIRVLEKTRPDGGQIGPVLRCVRPRSAVIPPREGDRVPRFETRKPDAESQVSCPRLPLDSGLSPKRADTKRRKPQKCERRVWFRAFCAVRANNCCA